MQSLYLTVQILTFSLLLAKKKFTLFSLPPKCIQLAISLVARVSFFGFTLRLC